MPCRATQDMATGEEDGKPLQYSCLENLMKGMKRQKKKMAPEDDPPGWKVYNMLPGKSRGHLLTTPVRMKGWPEAEMMLSCECVWW